MSNATVIRSALFLMAAGGLLAQGQTPSVGTASLGMVFDASIQGVRPVIGIAGAAIMTERLDLGFDLGSAAVSPQHDYVLATGGADPALRLFIIRGRSVDARSLPGANGPPDRIVFSPTGAAALFYQDGTAQVKIVTGLPDDPSIRQLDISGLEGGAAALAISDDGQALLAGVPGSMFLAVGSNIRRIQELDNASAAVFIARTHDALLLDKRGNRLMQWRDATGEVVAVAGELEGLSQPVAVAAARDGSRFFVANAGTRTVSVIDAKTGERIAVECQCAPTGLSSLNGRSVFRLTDPADGQIWVFDGDAPSPRIVFIPSQPAEQSGSQLEQE